VIEQIAAAGSSELSLKLTQLGLTVDRATCVDNLRRILEPAGRAGVFFVRIDMENSPYTAVTLDVFETMWQQGYRNAGVVLQSYLPRSESGRRAHERARRARAAREGRVQRAARRRVSGEGRRRRAFVRIMKMLLAEGTYPAIATHDPAMIDATRAFAASAASTRTIRVPDAVRHPPRPPELVEREGFASASTFHSAVNGSPTSCAGWANARQCRICHPRRARER
jgi:proline dehydrogenase